MEVLGIGYMFLHLCLAPPSSSEEHVLNARVPDGVDEFDSVDIVLK